MEPVSAGILAAASMLQGMLGGMAQKKQLEANIAQAGATGEYQMAQNRLAQQQEMQQGALSDLIAAYRSGLAGG